MKIRLSLIFLILFSLPIFADGRSQILADDEKAKNPDISKMQFLINQERFKEVYDVITVGENTIKISNAGFSRFRKRKVEFTWGNNKPDYTYLNEYFYSEKYKILACLWNDDVDWALLTIIDCASGKKIKELELYYPEIYSNFSMSPDGSKLLYKISGEKCFTVLDLSDMTESKYDIFPYDLNINFSDYCDAGFVRDNVIYCMSEYYDCGEKKNRICFYRIKDGKYTRITDFFNLPSFGYRYWKINGFNFLISVYDKCIYSYENKNLVNLSEKVQGKFVNPFYYDGAWYLATVAWDSERCKSGTVYIYDSALNCVNKCNFEYYRAKQGDYPGLVDYCCIDDGKIYFYITLDGK